MKKLLLLVTFAMSFYASAQDDLYIQNYTDKIIDYVIWKSNYASTSGNCSPGIQSNHMVKLGPAPSPLGIEAYYQQNVNTSNDFNLFFPDTPLINSWVVNSNYANLYNLPANPVPAALWSASKWSGIKFGVRNSAGVAIGGFYTMDMGCAVAGVPATLDLTGYPSPAVNGTIIQVTGATYFVFF